MWSNKKSDRAAGARLAPNTPTGPAGAPTTGSIAEIQAYLQTIRHKRLPGAPSDDIVHSLIIPKSSYSPWANDVEFRESYQKIWNKTLVDVYRCYELWSLVAQTSKVPGDILEVGVWRGGTGLLMALQARKVNPSARVYLCDTFAGVVKAGAKDGLYKGGEHSDTSLGMVQELIAGSGVDNVEIIRGIFPDDSGGVLDESTFSLCHIDVDVYDSAKGVFDWVWPRLSVGGSVVFDDYGFFWCDGVTKLGNELSSIAGGSFIHNLNGHAIITKYR